MDVVQIRVGRDVMRMLDGLIAAALVVQADILVDIVAALAEEQDCEKRDADIQRHKNGLLWFGCLPAADGIIAQAIVK